MSAHCSTRLLALMVVLTMSTFCCFVTDVTAGGLFAVTLYVEPGWAGEIQFGSYGTFASGTTIYVYVGSYQIAFIPSSNSSFYSWSTLGGVTVPQEFVYSGNGTAVVSGSGSLIALSSVFAQSAVVTLTQTITWSSTTTFVATSYFVSAQSALSLPPNSFQTTSNATEQTTKLLQPITGSQTETMNFETFIGMERSGENEFSIIMLVAALLLSTLLFLRYRSRSTKR